MKELYRLILHTYPNGDEHDQSFIGLLRTREEAECVAARYLAQVPGFRDYACDAEIIAVPYLGDGEIPEKVWSYSGWNSEDDCIDSWCCPTEAEAKAAMELAMKDHSRQEWIHEAHTVGKLYWEEGFVRDYPSGRIAPTLSELREGLRACVEPRKICALEFEYEDNKHYLFPALVGDQLFLAAEEDDFILDGFTIRRIRDIYELSDRVGVYQRLFEAEGLTGFDVPEVDVSDWRNVFASLQRLGRNIIVEREYEEEFFYIGRIEEVGDDHVLLRHFDADGVWQEEPVAVLYRDLTSVSFGTRYVDVFSKYV